MARAKGKRVKSATKVQETLKKVPAHCASCPILNPENMRPSWRFGRVYGPDGGIYGFPDDEKTRARILDFLRGIETQTLRELRQTDTYAVYSLAEPSTKAHLDSEVIKEVSRKFEDIYELHRFRLTGRQRLFAISVEPGIFELTWWDPDHRIYPVGKRHT